MTRSSPNVKYGTMGEIIQRQQTEGEQHPEQWLTDALSKGRVSDGAAFGPNQHQEGKADDEEIDNQLKLEGRSIDHADRLNGDGVARGEKVRNDEGADHQQTDDKKDQAGGAAVERVAKPIRHCAASSPRSSKPSSTHGTAAIAKATTNTKATSSVG